MPFTYLLNLRQDTANSCRPGVEGTPSTLPWDWTTQVPAAIAADKKQYEKWRNLPGITHHFYSPFEAVNPTARVVKPAAGMEGNPPCLLHGLVMDIDQQHTDAAIRQAVDRFPASRRPQWMERTASGNCRLVWIFEEAISVPNFEYAQHLLKTFNTSWGLCHTLGGFDEGAFGNPGQYFCNGGSWARLTSAAHPTAAELKSVAFAAATTFSWSTQREWRALPLEKVREQFMKDPRFVAAWGDLPFEIQQRGPSWWVDGSTSNDSAVLFATGMYTFAGHATKSFYSWQDLLGRAFVEGSTSTAVADAADGIYFDGKQYYRKNLKGQWKAFGKEDLIAFLTTTKHVNNKAPKGGVSDCARALQFIQEHHYVDGVAPVVFRPAGLIDINGKSVLNSSTLKAVAPAPGASRGWGKDFPYIASVIDAIFPKDYAGRAYFMSWLAGFYRQCLVHRLASGQNIVIAGGAGLGKTLLNRGIVGRLLGGGAEAADYLMGKDNFGGELFEKALWWLDDAGVAANREMHAVFSEALKKMAANRSHKVNVKFAMPTQTQWQGRVIVTCNDDAQSVRMIPSLDLNNADKLMLFRVPPGSRKIQFLDFDEGEIVIGQELPYFAQYLAEWETPKECIDPDPRFGGIKPFADAYLVSTANHSSLTAPLTEILDDFRGWWAGLHQDATSWRGTAVQLHSALNSDSGRKETMRSYPIDKLTQQLSNVMQKGYKPLTMSEEGDRRIWNLCLADAPSAGGSNNTPVTIHLGKPEKV
jgi:hypothetical protein